MNALNHVLFTYRLDASMTLCAEIFLFNPTNSCYVMMKMMMMMRMHGAVETVTTEYCKANDQLNVTSPTSGYIASVMTSDTPHCDGSSHPWVVAGRPGQRVNLTLYDFAVERPLRSFGRRQQHQATPAAATTAAADPAATEDAVCRQYGLVEDNGLLSADDGVVKPVAICSDGQRRIQHVYQSVGHVVKMWITAGVAPTDLKRFVIHYRGTVPFEFIHTSPPRSTETYCSDGSV